MSYDGFAIVAFLHTQADQAGEVVYTLKALADAIGWSKSDDALWRELRKLRDGGWVSFAVKPGQRAPYIIRLEKAAVRTSARIEPPHNLRKTSAAEPPSDAEVTSAARRSTGAAEPVTMQVSPPQHLRSAEPAREEVEVEVENVVVEDEEFEEAVLPLGALSREQRHQAQIAWAENPAGVRECVATARRGRNPPALFSWLIEEQRYLLVGRRSASKPDNVPAAHLAECMTYWLRNVGWTFPDWSEVEGEIAQQERLHDCQLDQDQRGQLQDLYRELHGEEAS